jgi:cytoskeletal protein CcmA (bactofilin family)
MGWFGTGTKDAYGAAVTARSSEERAASVDPAGAGRDSSTIGRRVQINGTVVSDEDLEIVGKVEGTIHARTALRVAREAEVKAVINGTGVLVEGAVNGDINASETLVLGATAVLTGNIKTPSLQIREGAFFRGQVTMQRAETTAGKDKVKAEVETKRQTAPAPVVDSCAELAHQTSTTG